MSGGAPSDGDGGGDGEDAAAVVRARLAAAGVDAPRAESVVIDLAGDPPLGRSAAVIAVEEADRIVAAAGAALLASRARGAVVAVRGADAEAAVRSALARVTAPAREGNAAGARGDDQATWAARHSGGRAARGAERAGEGDRAGVRDRRAASVQVVRARPGEAGGLGDPGDAPVRVVRVADLWPSVGVARDVGCDEGAWVLDGEAALDLEAAALARPRAPRRLTVAGHVTTPTVLRHGSDPPSVAAAVSAAGGAARPDWVALDGGAPGGWIVDRDDTPRSSLLLVLPAGHALVRRARTPVADWMVRAASACEACRACTDTCPVALDGGALEPHAVVAALVAASDPAARLAAAASCSGCGVCDAACPSALSPRALVRAVAAHLPPVAAPTSIWRRPPAHPDRPLRRLSVELLTARLGLAHLA